MQNDKPYHLVPISAEGSRFEDKADIMGRLMEAAARRGLALHPEPPPVPAGAADVAYVGPVRFIPHFNGTSDECVVRADVLCRDYSAEAT